MASGFKDLGSGFGVGVFPEGERERERRRDKERERQIERERERWFWMCECLAPAIPSVFLVELRFCLWASFFDVSAKQIK